MHRPIILRGFLGQLHCELLQNMSEQSRRYSGSMISRTFFLENGLEDEYVKYLCETYRGTNIYLCLSGGMAYILLLISLVLDGSDLVDQLLTLGRLVVTFAALFCFKSELVLRGNNAEIIAVVAFSVIMTLPMFLGADTFRYPADECFLQGKPIQEVKACSMIWMNFVFHQGIGSAIVLLATLWSSILRFRSMGFIFLCEIFRLLLRSLYLTPIPEDMVLVWTVFSIVILPSMLFGFAMVSDMNRRDFFLLQRSLRQRADNLRVQLDVAEKALEFGAPTAMETLAVHAAFNGVEDSFKDTSIAFQELDLRERIGAGTFGEVIKAEYAGATVAVKRMLRSNITNDKMIELMKDEVTLLRQLRHPNIVQFVGASWDSIVNVCIVCEFVERGDLSRVLQNPMLPLSWQDPQLRMMMDITSAIVFLHSRSPPVLHRDVKPDNVLVTNSFDCKLTDFGVSRAQIENTIGMTVVGTAHYMAPEMASGSFYSGKVDVYGLSMMLLVMHTRSPIKEAHDPRGHGHAQTRNSILHRVVKGRRPPIPADMPAPLVELMTSCWAQDPDDRPTAQEVLETLNSIQNKLWGGGEGGVLREKRGRSYSLPLVNIIRPSSISRSFSEYSGREKKKATIGRGKSKTNSSGALKRPEPHLNVVAPWTTP